MYFYPLMSTVVGLCLIRGYLQQFLCSSINCVEARYQAVTPPRNKATGWNRYQDRDILYLPLPVYGSHALPHTQQTARLFLFIQEMPLNKQTCFLAGMTINSKSKSTNYQIKVLFPFSPLLCRIYLGLVTLIAPDY
jgi:hypothetical protein